MTMDQKARELRIEEALKAHEQEPNPERIKMRWRGVDQTFPVISLPLDAVLLNHRSHRIKAHLESDPNAEKVRANPFSDESQETIARILRDAGDPDAFNDLKLNLAEQGQLQPGVVTRQGLLVNANTRAVALRDIDKPSAKYIRVAVLPTDADDRDIDDLEMQLQIQREFKRDYSFTNLLLFVHDLLEGGGHNEKEVARQLNYAASSDPKELREGVQQVQRLVRILATIRALQKRNAGQPRLTFFDDKRQALIDLDQAYEAAKKRNPRDAERLRDARLAGILTGCGYEALRKIDADTSVSHLRPRLENAVTLQGAVERLVPAKSNGATTTPAPTPDASDPLALLGGSATAKPSEGPSFRPLVDLLAKAQGTQTDTVTIPVEDGKTAEVERADLVAEIADAVDKAASAAKDAADLKKKIDGPRKLLAEATGKVNDAIDAYRDNHKRVGFDTAAFQKAHSELKLAMEALKSQVDK